MAAWIIEVADGRPRILYRNWQTGAVFDCGSTHPDTDLDLLLQWAMAQADSGDLILAPDHRPLLVQHPARA